MGLFFAFFFSKLQSLPSRFLILGIFTQELIDLDHGLFGSFSAAISGDLSLYIFISLFIATAAAGVMCRFIRLLVVVVVDLSWYGCMYLMYGCIVDKWVGRWGLCNE